MLLFFFNTVVEFAEIENETHCFDLSIDYLVCFYHSPNLFDRPKTLSLLLFLCFD